MRTRTVIIIGFLMIFSIFGGSSYLQWDCAIQIKNVSEYHKNMSIPAISTLDKIKLSFQEMHIVSIQTVQPDSKIKHMDEHSSYQESKDIFQSGIEKYDSLAHVRNSNGEFFASEMMQVQMKKYVSVFEEIINRNDVVIEQYQNGEISSTDAVSLLASIEIDFHEKIEQSSQMEINGMEKTQNEILEIEAKMEQIFLISGGLAIMFSAIMIILTTRFVSYPLSRLIEETKRISSGKSFQMKLNSENSDVNDVLKAFNEMSKDLEKYKLKIIKQEKMSAIGELASRLAHDIRNPLTIIKVTLDVIKTKNKNLTPEEIEKFERVETAMYRITHQIDNVLDFIKEKPLKFENYLVSDIVNSVIEDLPKSDKISIEIVCENSEIKCDFEAMKVVLINLTVNAIQAIKNNEGKIRISSKVRGDNVIIEIEDSGPGIPKEILEKIFDPLYTTKEEGTGLGLVSCKSIVDQHHGKISVKNNPTRFIVELPKNIQ